MDDLRALTTGTAARISPDGKWVAYVAGDEVRIVNWGGESQSVADLAQVGGTDRHRSSGCTGVRCSYRQTTLVWMP